MISKTKMFDRAINKNDSELVETIMACKKNEAWMKVGIIISRSRSQMPVVNLDKINKIVSDGDTVVVPGKVLSQGDISKKIKIAALKFSGNAREKLSKNKSEIITILDEIKKNPSAKGIKVIA